MQAAVFIGTIGEPAPLYRSIEPHNRMQHTLMEAFHKQWMTNREANAAATAGAEGDGASAA